MSLTSLQFFISLAIASVTAMLVPAKVRYIWLLTCNILFLLYNPVNFLQNLPYVSIMLCIVLISYLGAMGIGALASRGAKRAVLGITLVCCLVLLFGCKYFRYSLAQFIPGLFPESGSLFYQSLLLPLGLSYYTLQAIGYVLDVYRGGLQPENNPFVYTAYISFFPGLVAGPINSAKKMLGQFKNPGKILYANLSGGAFRVLWGVFKKIMLANPIAAFTLPVLARPANYEGPSLVLAWLLFVVQLYLDFSAYSDIAIGAAYMMGFTFTENFNRPFAAASLPEFWQRWHISLLVFLREYIYNPLLALAKPPKDPEKKKKPVLPALLTLLMFLVLGALYGPGIAFVVWGGVTGVLVAIAVFFQKSNVEDTKKSNPVLAVLKRILVAFVFTVCGILFASGLYSFSLPEFFTGLTSGWGNIAQSLQVFTDAFSPPDNGGFAFYFPAICVSLALVVVVEWIALRKAPNVSVWVRSQRFYVRWPIYFIVLALLILFGKLQQNIFIYSQF